VREYLLVLFVAMATTFLLTGVARQIALRYGAVAKVRAREAAQGGLTPAVAVTAYGRVEDRVRLLAAGYNMHVPKPVEPAELVAVIAALARRPPTNGGP